MIRLRVGNVKEVLNRNGDIEELMVEVDGMIQKAINYPAMTGPAKKNDRVALNTTALTLNLGTGGYHFVMFNYSNTIINEYSLGHIMKLRYTPFQIKCMSSEEHESHLREKIERIDSLDNMPVVIAPLHSMIPPVCAAIKLNKPESKVAYVMTDGGALPIFFSRLVYILKQKKMIDITVTEGHAFGGDLEAVNVYSALLAAKAWGADIAVVSMGPGITGTGTKFGNTGLEQGEIINAVNILKGFAIAVPRISFADNRSRHFGVSHHTLTALSLIAITPATLVLPEEMDKEKLSFIYQQLQQYGIIEKHIIEVRKGFSAIKHLKDMGIHVTTMGRSYDEDPEFFLTAGAAGLFSIEKLF
ncbi:MAG TPA: DUF3866 family protein [Thermoanaerobacterales bacterium]|nr:DUF3866 family protein [Thermoanaerobacterales bacterium]